MKKLMDDQFIRKKALCYAHYLYRNTMIEVYHSSGCFMDQHLYTAMCKIVDEKLKELAGKDQIVDKVLLNDPSVIDDIIQTPKNGILKTINLCQDIAADMKAGRNWDEAEILPFNSQTRLCQYILNGNFKKYCDEARILTDENMKALNKDIHNRIYTALIKGALK
jgi:hypothetical protein